MALVPEIASSHEEMKQWRQDLHAHPELGFEEVRTSEFVSRKLTEWGISVTRGLAGTGVVGTLQGRAPGVASIGLRADMDALPVLELNSFEHASKNPGKMHACGHDGHTTMLLGAARHLSRSRDFSGTVHFIFQPAEEGLGGGDRMIKEGLFSRFPMDAIYGLHNWPGMPLGTIGIRPGPMMASADILDIEIKGKGGHGAMPHLAIDPIVIGAHIVTALQTLVSRSADPLQSSVLSITAIEAGNAHNVIPESVHMRGSVRTFSPIIRDLMERGIQRIACGVAESLGATATVQYRRLYPVLINAPGPVQIAVRAAVDVAGADNVNDAVEPVMGSEDFAFMLEAKSGAYAFLGQAGPSGSCMVHSPHYDFNDDLLPIGASFWVSLVRQTPTQQITAAAEA
jgi:hippurate hydrolase